MKKLIVGVSCFLLSLSWITAQVTYHLSYDMGTSTYTVSVRSGTTYSGGLSRLSNSTQVTLVTPHTTGGFQITNLTDLQAGGTPLDWGLTRLDAPAENTSKDYLLFSPTNSTTYSPFNIPANTSLDLFSFQSGSGCLGNLNLFDNVNDPLNSNNLINADNNFVVIGGGLTNQYTGNTSTNVSCLDGQITYCLSYDSGLQTYTVSLESSETYTGGLSRLTPSTQVSIVVPHTSGGFQITNLTDLQSGATPLDWQMNRIDAPTENNNKDYLFFSPGNALAYTPFDITANTAIDLFSFQSGSGCLGDIALFDNLSDPLNANPSLNPSNNAVIVGGGAGNQYTGNSCPSVPCTSAEISYCINYNSTTQVYTVSMESNEAFTGGLARITPSTQVTLLFPHTSGGFQISNLMGLQASATPLAWATTRLDAPTENSGIDYLFFAPTNAISYTPFDIAANTPIELFSFQSGSGCLGDVTLFNNTTDPLNSNMLYNPKNSATVVGAGIGNKYSSNSCPKASCSDVCTIKAGVLSY